MKNVAIDDADEQEPLRHRALAQPARLRLLRLLAAEGPLDVQALAARLALREPAVRRHLDVLVRAGLAAVEPGPAEPATRRAPGRPRLLYRAGPAAGRPRVGYPLLADMLAGSLHRLGDAAAVEEEGRAWGRRLIERPLPPLPVDAEDARGRLTAMLDRLGFAPGSGAGGAGAPIEIHRCPFLDTASAYPGVVCSLHLGLMQGALAELEAPLETERLDPLVEPSLCVAHLRATD